MALRSWRGRGRRREAAGRKALIPRLTPLADPAGQYFGDNVRPLLLSMATALNAVKELMPINPMTPAVIMS